MSQKGALISSMLVEAGRENRLAGDPEVSGRSPIPILATFSAAGPGRSVTSNPSVLPCLFGRGKELSPETRPFT